MGSNKFLSIGNKRDYDDFDNVGMVISLSLLCFGNIYVAFCMFLQVQVGILRLEATEYEQMHLY
jgi:hypothetical protein